MRYFFYQPGRTSWTSVIIGALFLGFLAWLFVMSLPVLLGIAGVICLIGLAVWLYNYVRVRLGFERPEEKAFRETMEAFNREATERYGETAGSANPSAVYKETRVVRTVQGTRRRRMRDVEDIEENR